MYIVEVLLPYKYFNKAFFYSKDILFIGDLVQVTVRNKVCFGIVNNIVENSELTLKEAKHIFSLGESFVKYIVEFSKENFCCTSYIVKYIGNIVEKKPKQFTPEYHLAEIHLTEEQQNCFTSIINNKLNLLWGVTGSGKTEIFFKIINDCMKNGQVLLLLPEIAITESIKRRFKEKFNFNAEVWHSKSKSKKSFTKIMHGAPVVIGSRSAILLPFKNLKWIIIDEEHDKSYKQENTPFYHCRSAAMLRSKVQNINILLASATPSIESYFATQQGDIQLVKLETRYLFSQPKITVVMENQILNSYTEKRILEELSKNNQIIIFLNRRGWSSYCFCKVCNSVPCCACSSTLHFHKRNNILLCHFCHKKYRIDFCSNCKGWNTLNFVGWGVEKLEELIKEKFKCETAILSSDFYGPKEIGQFIQLVESNKVKIIIGTQMISKGHNFPKISLVVIAQWQQFGFDWRSNEWNVQNILQVTGRAGRKQGDSEVIIQTAHRNPILNFVFSYEEFLKQELIKRKTWNLPPYSVLAAFLSNSIASLKSLYNKVEHAAINTPSKCQIWNKEKFYFICFWKEDFRSLIDTSISVNIDPYDLNI